MRVELIGAGRIGAFHAQTMADHTAVTDVVVTDPLLERAEAVAADVGGSVAPDATNVHAEMMLLAAEAGIPEFCEKPTATDLPATDVVVERLRSSGIPGAGYDGWYFLEEDLVLDEEPAEGEGPIAINGPVSSVYDTRLHDSPHGPRNRVGLEGTGPTAGGPSVG